MGTHTSRRRDPINNCIVPEDTPLPQMLHQISPPILRLPNEILAEIFEHAIALEQTGEFCSHDEQLQRLVRVCRHWHAVAMAYPRLWSSLVFTSVETTALMLQRSKEFPLVVKADFTYKRGSKPPVKQAVLLALSNTSRIRVLHIQGTKRFHGRLIGAVTHQRAPLLESLRLTSWIGRGHEITLPASLFANTTPRLRHFSVSHLSVSWRSPLLYNLTHLEIYNTSTPALVEFHYVLTRCPALSTLIVINVLPAASEQLLLPVFLPLLSYLNLAGSLERCEVVMHSISFPRTTAVALDFWRTPGALPLHFLSNLRDRLSTIARLFLRINDVSTRVQAWTTDPVAIRNPALELFFLGAFNVPHFHAICEGLALTQLFSLEVEVAWIKREECEAVLNTLQHIQALTVRNRDVGVPISILKPMHGRAVPLPGLRELTLDGVKTELTTIPDLLACLMLRRDNHADIETLRLSLWYDLRKVDVDMLRAALGIVVEWDGIELCWILGRAA
jgi:hypothetical protein